MRDDTRPNHDDVSYPDRVERLPDASHWVHHDEAEEAPEAFAEAVIDVHNQ
jgi:pimeloyl-ACP methyl ester carboxylesterase